MAESFAQRLKKKRGKRLQKEFAAELNIKLRTYQEWEQGRTEPKELAMAELDRRLSDL